MTKHPKAAGGGAPTPEASPAARPSRRGLLVAALALLLAGLAIAIVAVVYRPDYVVLVRMDEVEERWFRARLAKFAEDKHVRLTTRAYADGAELERLLRASSLERKSRLLLAQVPQSMLAPLVEEDLVRPIEDVRGRPRARQLVARMAPEAATPAVARGQAQYVPATLSTPLLFWSKARLADALAHWEADRPRIAAALAGANGTGLPRDYRLEPDPADWDTYDVAVVAAYWAGHPYDGLTVPRVAHAAIGEEAGLDLATRAYAQGARAEELVTLDGVALRDALAWESLFFAAGWYHPSMTNEGWATRDLLAAAAQGQIFLGWLDSADLFRLHGTGAPGLEGFLRDPADLGVARVPRGASLDLERGQPARSGDPWAAIGGTWWGIPRSAPDAPLAAALADELAGRAFQQDWARAFGRLPARRDLLAEIDIVFEADWAFAIARTAKKQALDLGHPLPNSATWRRAQDALIAAWHEACAGEHERAPLALARTLARHLAGGSDAAGAAGGGAAAGAADSTTPRGD